jgi:hypothetical protein
MKGGWKDERWLEAVGRRRAGPRDSYAGCVCVCGGVRLGVLLVPWMPARGGMDGFYSPRHRPAALGWILTLHPNGQRRRASGSLSALATKHWPTSPATRIRLNISSAAVSIHPVYPGARAWASCWCPGCRRGS